MYFENIKEAKAIRDYIISSIKIMYFFFFYKQNYNKKINLKKKKKWS